jgi:transposase-like protein
MPKATFEEAARRVSAINLCLSQGLGVADAAQMLGMKANALHEWWRNYRIREAGRLVVAAPPTPPPAAAPPEVDPAERRDAAFWKRKAADLSRRLDEVEHLAAELGGVSGIPVNVPEWAEMPSTGGGRSVLIVHTSDLHLGEVITPGEIQGLNAYSPEVAEARMQRLFQAACEIGPRWMHGDTCDGVLLTMAGDLMSGDIHEELRMTNALTSTEQVAGVVGIYAAGVRLLAERFGKVHVVAVPGNHGRTTPKPTAKLASRLSYDILAARILREKLQEDGRVTWQIADGADARVPVYGRTILATHGDRMGTGGGHGFAGPVLPIVRGSNKVRLQSQSAGMDCDLILMGHYHTSAAPPGVLANGSVVGYSEYGNGLRASVEPPKQWLARFSARWGLCERLDVQLDEVKPRMRFKA